MFLAFQTMFHFHSYLIKRDEPTVSASWQGEKTVSSLPTGQQSGRILFLNPINQSLQLSIIVILNVL